MPGRKLPPLNALRAFEAAARHESFIKAADELFVTPPAVSQQVKQLEEWLDIKLFIRRPRGITLTDSGKAYLHVLTELFDRLADATELMRQAPASRVLTVCVTPGFAALWLSPRLWRFANAHPELDIRVSASVRPLDPDREDVDVAIPYGSGNYRGYTSELLLSDGLTPVCAPSLLNGEHPLRTPADLAHHTLLHNESSVVAGLHATWQDWLQSAGVERIDPQRGVRFSDLHLVMQEAIAGRGVALGHLALIGEELRAGRLVQPFPHVMPASGDYHLVYKPSAERNPKAAAFLGWLRAQAAREHSPAPEHA